MCILITLWRCYKSRYCPRRSDRGVKGMLELLSAIATGGAVAGLYRFLRYENLLPEPSKETVWLSWLKIAVVAVPASFAMFTILILIENFPD